MQINASIADDTSTITIINSDPLPSWEINVLEEIYVNEGDKVFTYNVNLDYGSVSENPLDIDYLISLFLLPLVADYNAYKLRYNYYSISWNLVQP